MAHELRVAFTFLKHSLKKKSERKLKELFAAKARPGSQSLKHLYSDPLDNQAFPI